MFETLFSKPAVLRRHRTGPLAAERAEYLGGIAAQGAALGTLVRRGRYCLCVAREVGRWPTNHHFAEAEICELANVWAARRVEERRARGPKWPAENFRSVALDFLRAIGRLDHAPAPVAGRYDKQLDDFITAQRESRWLSAATCRSGRWQVERFLVHLEQQGVALGDVAASHVDSYFQHMAQRWNRVSLYTSAKLLRSWFAHCERRDWVRRGLAAGILMPRIYRQEGLPLGPTWDEVGRMLANTVGDEPAQLRDQAILRLLSIYGWRSGEVRRLRLEDLDWRGEQVSVTRSKTSRCEVLPLEPTVGNAIARYLRHGRPKSQSRVVFLTLLAPHRPLSAGALYGVVHRHLLGRESTNKGRGPHGLRHACARHLVESGLSFKEIGDHLGHHSPESTRIYAKVDLVSLRRVAFDDLGGLA
ncbi:MAG: tyrosine-type recombinase/integrase [Candidatus Wallbacteria bacterium]|nr:tyrosine-type recombinase/integrase [Candidatus Wallbacteria bacterium]